GLDLDHGRDRDPRGRPAPGARHRRRICRAHPARDPQAAELHRGRDRGRPARGHGRAARPAGGVTRFLVQRSRVSSRAPSTPSERLRGREFERAADTGRLIGERDAALELLWERFLDQARTEAAMLWHLYRRSVRLAPCELERLASGIGRLPDHRQATGGARQRAVFCRVGGELVQRSESIIAQRGSILISGPEIRTRSLPSAAYGRSTFCTISRTGALFHFSSLSSAWVLPIDTRRPSNFLRASTGSAVSRKVWAATDCTIASVFFIR